MKMVKKVQNIPYTAALEVNETITYFPSLLAKESPPLFKRPLKD